MNPPRRIWATPWCSRAFRNSAEEDLGDAVVFQGVSKYPMRIKCALLGWEGMKASVAEALARMQ